MYSILHLISLFACAVSERTIWALGGALGWLWFHVLRYRRGVILENLGRAFPELDPGARRTLGLEVAQHLCRSFLELLRIPRYRAGDLEQVVELRGGEHLRAAYEGKTGFFALTGHFGSFELCAGAIATRVLPWNANLVVKSFPAGVDRFLTELREEAGYKIIRDKRTLPGILRALKRGEAVVFVLDQNATRDQGVFVDFFGEEASTMAALALMARRSGVPVLGIEIWREGPGKHVVEFSPPFDATTTSDDPTTELTQRYTRFIEAAIRRHPAQWLWTHKRWKTKRARVEAP